MVIHTSLYLRVPFLPFWLSNTFPRIFIVITLGGFFFSGLDLDKYIQHLVPRVLPREIDKLGLWDSLRYVHGLNTLLNSC